MTPAAMINRTTERLHPMVVLAIGLAAVALLLRPDIDDAVRDVYDKFFPVVTAEAIRVTPDGDGVALTAKYSKHRDCERVSAQAYSMLPDRSLQPAAFDRVSPGPLGLMHLQAGESATSTHRIWPTAGARGIVVYMEHRCVPGSDRKTWTRVLEAKL